MGRAGRQRGHDEAMRLLHLPPRGAPERVAALRVVAGGEGVEEPGHPAGEVADRREQAAHRREGAVRVVPSRISASSRRT